MSSAFHGFKWRATNSLTKRSYSMYSEILRLGQKQQLILLSRRWCNRTAKNLFSIARRFVLDETKGQYYNHIILHFEGKISHDCLGSWLLSLLQKSIASRLIRGIVPKHSQLNHKEGSECDTVLTGRLTRLRSHAPLLNYWLQETWLKKKEALNSTYMSISIDFAFDYIK